MAVESVSLEMPPEFSVAGSPVTNTGGFVVGKVSQSSAKFWGSPFNAPGAPVFRSILPTDIGSGAPTVDTYLRGDGSWDASNTIVRAAVDGSPLALTVLAVSGIGYTASNGSYVMTLDNVADAQHFAVGWPVVVSAGWATADQEVGAVDTVAGTVTLLNPANGTGPGHATVTPIGYAWEEVTADALTGAYYPKPGGKSGSASSNPAIFFNVEYSGPNIISDVYWLLLRTTATPTPVWEFEAADAIEFPIPVSVAAGSGIAVSYDGISVYTVSLAAALPSVAAGSNVSVSVSGSVYTVEVPSFPYSDLTGVPTPPSVAGGTNVTVSSSGSVYTVDVATFPAGDVTGTLPASQVGSGYPASDLTGTLPASQVGSGYPYAELTGAPSPGGMKSVAPAVTTITGTAQTVFNLSGSNGMIGTVAIKNTGSATITVTGSYTDAFGTVVNFSGIPGIAGGSSTTLYFGLNELPSPGTGQGCPTNVTVKLNTGGTSTTITGVAQYTN